ncbi:MAG: uracil-DNA glycosylase [Saprospiraceae bacterium]
MATPNVKIEESWKEALADQFDQPYFAELRSFLQQEKEAGKQVFPPGSLIFNAFNTTPFKDVKVVILGQDPYHGPGQAMGLSFSVPRGKSVPPSLRNIYKELETSTDFTPVRHGDLTAWADQGVFLLNAMLTVEARKAGSHKKAGWQEFTDAAIKALSEQRENLVFILWGAFAQKKAELIDEAKHLVLTSAHPSPYSADKGFFGNNHFQLANDYLKEHGREPIDWQLAE